MLKKLFNKSRTKYPAAVDSKKVGKYSALVKSGGGYFYDEVLEYRVWVHPEAGGEDLYDGEDYFFVFETYQEALKFSKKTKGAEPPLVLILQKEHVNEPEPGVFEHIKTKRITEWKSDWLKGRKRDKDSIKKFMEENR